MSNSFPLLPTIYAAFRRDFAVVFEFSSFFFWGEELADFDPILAHLCDLCMFLGIQVPLILVNWVNFALSGCFP